MIALQEGFDLSLQGDHLARFVFAPAEAFFPQRAIKTLDMGLFILLVRPCHTMTVAKQSCPQSKLAFELRAAVVLQ